MSNEHDHYYAERVYRNALSRIPMHNHLVRAYHEANQYRRIPSDEKMWTIPTSSVPVKVLMVVDAKVVYDEAKQRIVVARDAIEDLRAQLDRDVERVVYHTPDRPDAVHDHVAVTRFENEGFAPGWKYAYNPFQLAILLLDEFERYIDSTMASGLEPFTVVSRICMKAQQFECSVRLVTSRLSLGALVR